MNKKLIIGIVAGVVALAIIITAAVLIIKKIDINAPDDGSSSIDGTSSGDDTASVIEGGSVSLGTAKAEKGDTIEVPIKLEDNPGVFACQIAFDYDEKALEFVDYEDGDIFDNWMISGSKLVGDTSSLKDVTKDGTLLVLQFKVRDGAAKGDYTIKLTEESVFANYNEQFVCPKIGEGKITVK